MPAPSIYYTGIQTNEKFGFLLKKRSHKLFASIHSHSSQFIIAKLKMTPTTCEGAALTVSNDHFVTCRGTAEEKFFRVALMLLIIVSQVISY